MNAISLCCITPELPESISLDLLFVQMRALEQHLAGTNPLFEKDTYMAIMARLAPIYFQINHTMPGKRIERYSDIKGQWQPPKRKIHCSGKIVIN